MGLAAPLTELWVLRTCMRLSIDLVSSERDREEHADGRIHRQTERDTDKEEERESG